MPAGVEEDMDLQGQHASGLAYYIMEIVMVSASGRGDVSHGLLPTNHVTVKGKNQNTIFEFKDEIIKASWHIIKHSLRQLAASWHISIMRNLTTFMG